MLSSTRISHPQRKQTNQATALKFCQTIRRLLSILKWNTVNIYLKSTPGNVANKFTFERINVENFNNGVFWSQIWLKIRSELKCSPNKNLTSYTTNKFLNQCTDSSHPERFPCHSVHLNRRMHLKPVPPLSYSTDDNTTFSFARYSNIFSYIY